MFGFSKFVWNLKYCSLFQKLFSFFEKCLEFQKYFMISKIVRNFENIQNLQKKKTLLSQQLFMNFKKCSKIFSKHVRIDRCSYS